MSLIKDFFFSLFVLFLFTVAQPLYLSPPLPHPFYSHLPLSLPCHPYMSPVDCYVRCCCAVDKTQSLSHPSCTWDSWLVLFVRACVHACMRACVCVYVHVLKKDSGRDTNSKKKKNPEPIKNIV